MPVYSLQLVSLQGFARVISDWPPLGMYIRFAVSHMTVQLQILRLSNTNRNARPERKQHILYIYIYIYIRKYKCVFMRKSWEDSVYVCVCV